MPPSRKVEGRKKQKQGMGIKSKKEKKKKREAQNEWIGWTANYIAGVTQKSPVVWPCYPNITHSVPPSIPCGRYPTYRTYAARTREQFGMN